MASTPARTRPWRGLLYFALGIGLLFGLLVASGQWDNLRRLFHGVPAREASPAPPLRFDVHQHVSPSLMPAAVRLARSQGIYGFVNLSGGGVGGALEAALKAAEPYGGTVVTFMNPDWEDCCDAAWGTREAARIEQGAKMGARGVKIFKHLGLGLFENDRRVPVDSERLEPLWLACEKAGIPVSIHVGDPKAFFEPMGPANERMDELGGAPEWSFADRTLYPSWPDLYAEFLRLVEKHPRLTFIGVHFGNDPEDPAEVSRQLDRLPNLYVDTAARVPELGRAKNAAATRAAILAHPDRVLFGTDTQWIGNPGRYGVIYGAGDAYGPRVVDARDRFYGGNFRFFETRDAPIPSPTPIQGRWDVQGIGLPGAALERLYHENAERLLGVRPPSTGPSPGR